MVTRAATLLGPAGMSMVGVVVTGLVVLVGVLAIVALLLIDHQDECVHRRRMARARRRQHG